MWSRRSFTKTGVLASAGSLLSGVDLAQQVLAGDQGGTPSRGHASDDILTLSIADAADLLHRRKISPVDLTSACLARIQRLNPVLNAFITVTPELAMGQAREAEVEIQHGRWRGPLHGIPVGLKDLIDTAGVRTTCASAVFADRVPAEDAEVVRRLKRAGAVLVGKHNMHEFAYGGTSVPSHYGPVHNPWDLARIAGGSSGGSAAALASGLCFAAIGSDTGGSIREPAAYCGIVGLKPTYGRVSARGVVPLSWSLDHIGPICRTVADAALLLEVLAGYDPLDSASVDWPTARYANIPNAKTLRFRVGVVRRMFFEDLDPEIEAAVHQAIEVIRHLVATVRDVELPAGPPPAIVGPEAYAFHTPYFTKTPNLYQPSVRGRLQQASMISATAYVEARRQLDQVRRSVGSVFSTIDLLITPTTPVPALEIAEAIRFESPAPGAEPWMRNTRPFNALALPAISIPCGFSRAGLPIGLQIAGPRFGEAQVFALAHAFEQATDWHQRMPPL
jgi:aspartyl-tRNA(Asn)/glutamyl-tRNA(Gln) amidotransferase subunit A